VRRGPPVCCRKTAVFEGVRWSGMSLAWVLRWSGLWPHHGAPAFARLSEAVAHLGEIDPGRKRELQKVLRSRPPKPQTGTWPTGWGMRTGTSIINRKGLPEIVRSSNQSVPTSSDSPKAAGPRTHVRFLSGEREPPTGKPWASDGAAGLFIAVSWVVTNRSGPSHSALCISSAVPL
jgi:hypothetical protein